MADSLSRKGSAVDASQRKIFIGGLSYSTDDENLKQYFEVYGEVQDSIVMKDAVSKRSRGFGFITFTEAISVDNVLNAFQTSSTSSAIINDSIGTVGAGQASIDGRRVEVKRAVPRSGEGAATASAPSSGATSAGPKRQDKVEKSREKERGRTVDTEKGSRDRTTHTGHGHGTEYSQSGTKIFVGGLHYDTRDAEFKAYFEKFGRVVASEVMFNRETHKSRGFGFVVYETERAAERACAAAEHVIDGRVVEVKRATPKSKIGSGSSSGTSSTSQATSTSTSKTTKAVEKPEAARIPPPPAVDISKIGSPLLHQSPGTKPKSAPAKDVGTIGGDRPRSDSHSSTNGSSLSAPNMHNPPSSYAAALRVAGTDSESHHQSSQTSQGQFQAMSLNQNQNQNQNQVQAPVASPPQPELLRSSTETSDAASVAAMSPPTSLLAAVAVGSSQGNSLSGSTPGSLGSHSHPVAIGNLSPGRNSLLGESPTSSFGLLGQTSQGQGSLLGLTSLGAAPGGSNHSVSTGNNSITNSPGGSGLGLNGSRSNSLGGSFNDGLGLGSLLQGSAQQSLLPPQQPIGAPQGSMSNPPGLSPALQPTSGQAVGLQMPPPLGNQSGPTISPPQPFDPSSQQQQRLMMEGQMGAFGGLVHPNNSAMGVGVAGLGMDSFYNQGLSPQQQQFLQQQQAHLQMQMQQAHMQQAHMQQNVQMQDRSGNGNIVGDTSAVPGVGGMPSLPLSGGDSLLSGGGLFSNTQATQQPGQLQQMLFNPMQQSQSGEALHRSLWGAMGGGAPQPSGQNQFQGRVQQGNQGTGQVNGASNFMMAPGGRP